MNWRENTPLLERIARKIRLDDGCWSWDGAHTKERDGSLAYARIAIDGTPRGVHRMVWELLNGPIPEGLVTDHLCRNKSCVNPSHLELVTYGENNRRAQIDSPQVNRRTAWCKHGHEYTEENTYISPRGDRRCRACKRARSRKHMEGSVI